VKAKKRKQATKQHENTVSQSVLSKLKNIHAEKTEEGNEMKKRKKKKEGRKRKSLVDSVWSRMTAQSLTEGGKLK
jgi:hypothetical protein